MLVKIIKNNQTYKNNIADADKEIKNNYSYDIPIFGGFFTFCSDFSEMTGKAWDKVFGGEEEGNPDKKDEKFSGKIVDVSLNPGEKKEIGYYINGQRWRYLSFSGQFYHRINKGDDKATWRLIDENITWRGYASGTLEVKAGNKPVELKINIL